MAARRPHRCWLRLQGSIRHGQAFSRIAFWSRSRYSRRIACRGENPVYDELMRRGVTIDSREVVRLPAPTVADGLTAAQQRQAIEAIADGRSWEDLTRRSVNAPFVFKISRDENDPSRLGRRVDLWFVAYGNMGDARKQRMARATIQDDRQRDRSGQWRRREGFDRGRLGASRSQAGPGRGRSPVRLRRAHAARSSAARSDHARLEACKHPNRSSPRR